MTKGKRFERGISKPNFDKKNPYYSNYPFLIFEFSHVFHTFIINFNKKTISEVPLIMSDTNISYVLRSSKNIDIVDQNWMMDSLSDDGKKNDVFF